MSAKRPEEERPLREQFAWTYGHLSMAHAAVAERATRYGPHHYAIRTRFRYGYLRGTITMEALHADEKTKIRYGTTCSYCGAETMLTLDHLIPQLRGGPHAADNITYACRSCNSSKGPRDMMAWLTSKGKFPGLLVFRRYLKITARWCEDVKLMETPWNAVAANEITFDKHSVRVKWPSLEKLELWPQAQKDSE